VIELAEEAIESSLIRELAGEYRGAIGLVPDL